ncbi:MAG: hypothetical protein K0S07_1078 [Chlamydiales bacterium]|jgi:hypothetical protein|nr:hypothetical protein [Chlamydiales bacterium]
MQVDVLNTPTSVYNTIIDCFPSATVKVHAHKTNAVAVKILLQSSFPEVQLNGAVYKHLFELKVRIIKILQMARTLTSSAMSRDCLILV